MKKSGIVLLLLFFAACAKDELPENIQGIPVFQSNFNFNGSEFSLAAGQNGLTLSPSVSLTDSSAQFVSKLSNPACPECGPGIQVVINSPEAFLPESTTDWIAQLENWIYTLEIEPVEPSTALNLSIDNGNPGSQGDWFLDGNQINSELSSAIDLTLIKQGIYEVSFQDINGSCASGPPLIIEYNGTQTPCYGTLSQDLLNPNLIIAQPSSAFDQNNTGYVWFVGGEIISTLNANTIEVDVNAVSEICVLMLDGTCEQELCFIPINDAIPCANNIKINSSELSTVQPEPSSESLVMIEFRDNDGVIYTSDGLQTNSSIELISVQPYTEPTMPDQSFAEIVLEVSCILYSSDGQGFQFNGVINLALKLP